MGKAKRNGNKLDDAWATWFIDVVVGYRMIMLAARESAGTARLGNILKTVLKDLYTLDKYRDKDGSEFIRDAEHKIHELIGIFIVAKAKKHLVEGVPEPATIIPHSGGRGRMN